MKCEAELASKEKVSEIKLESVQTDEETYNILTRMVNTLLVSMGPLFICLLVY